jgi:hypothetical protein
MMSGWLALMGRAAIAALAAYGLEQSIGLPLLVGAACLLGFLALELALAAWTRRHPLGSMYRVLTLVLLRLSQPLVWALAVVGIVEG